MEREEKPFNPVLFKRKLKKGLDLSFKKLLETKKKNDGVLVFSRNGKIVKIKARDFVK
jgi:hypothetical protein